ncbi:MAG: Mov34/MPN/PAD-1 family protein [Deltaproteobacteria bacterium]|nr:Mov34/MPN/PAD-1 family protein [Sandaracinaceae bacterium]MCX7807415.1 Mov34/MPN/PAD-1 family protein [Deltaproteobacteria bacterium]MDW8247521.1 Mov34/MPN/PAD-1 family protein [Sandaracinaceae bacterium]
MDRPLWTFGPIAMPLEALALIRSHAESTYPSECCGFGAGPAAIPELVDEVFPEVNEADRYHAIDPIRFPRTSRTYFKINEIRAQKLFKEAAARGRPIKLIYHSHCDAGDYFSAEDAATFVQEGVLTWPCAFLVVSVRNGCAVSERLWVHVEGSDRFEQAPLLIRSTY